MAARLTLRLQAWLFGPGKLEAGEVFLHRRRVYILPNKAGYAFALLVLILLIGSINYSLAWASG